MALDIECCNAECRDYLNVMLSVFMLSVLVLSEVLRVSLFFYDRNLRP
jgi:hypothetical protein